MNDHESLIEIYLLLSIPKKKDHKYIVNFKIFDKKYFYMPTKLTSEC